MLTASPAGVIDLQDGIRFREHSRRLSGQIDFLKAVTRSSANGVLGVTRAGREETGR